MSPWGRSRWPAWLPRAHPTPRAPSSRQEPGTRGLPKAGRDGPRAQPAKQAQPSPDAGQTSQAFFPARRGPGGTDPALLRLRRRCSSQRTSRLAPSGSREPHVVPWSSRLAPLTPDYGNEVKASGSPANSHHVSPGTRDATRELFESNLQLETLKAGGSARGDAPETGNPAPSTTLGTAQVLPGVCRGRQRCGHWAWAEAGGLGGTARFPPCTSPAP